MTLPAPGTAFAGHLIEAVVGRGGMGIVYRARHLELGRVVALKVIAPELLEDDSIRERFLKEARTAASIEHPNVIPVHDAGESDGVAYIAMRFVMGDDLRTVVRRDGPLGLPWAAEIAMKLGAALDAMHSAGYVHRDVKPANVLIASDDHIYLSDFGLAKQIVTRSGATRTGQWVGTLDYVAPEQIRGGRIDARADVYSLGGVLYFALTGHAPYERENDEAKLWAHLSHPPPVPSELRPGLPPAFDAVVTRALAKEPSDRFPSTGDLGRAAIAAVHGGEAPAGERTVARGAAAPDAATTELGIADESTLSSLHPIAATDLAPKPSSEPPSPPRHRLAAALALLAAAGVAVTAIVLLSGGSDPPSAPKPAASATPTASPKPATGPRVGKTITHVGHHPTAIAIAGNRVWVTGSSDTKLIGIDASSSRRLSTHPVVGAGTKVMATDGNDVWVANRRARNVVRVDSGTGKVTGRVALTELPAGVAAGPSGLWVAVQTDVPGAPEALLHYDRRGIRLLGRVTVPEGIGALALGAGAVWVGERRRSQVLRVDPQTGQYEEWGPGLTGVAKFLVYGSGYVWASMRRGGDTIARIDPDSGRTVLTAAGGRPMGIAVAGGRVYVANNTDHTLSVISPRTTRPTHRPLSMSLNPFGVAAGRGHVWVTGAGDNTLTRVDYR